MEDVLASALSTAGLSVEKLEYALENKFFEDQIIIENIIDEGSYLEKYEEINIKTETSGVDDLVEKIYYSQSTKKDYLAEGFKDPDMKEWDEVLFQMTYKDGKNWSCKECDYKHHRKGYILSHVETYHPPRNFPCYKCLKCDVIVPNRHNFQAHVSKKHKDNQTKTKILRAEHESITRPYIKIIETDLDSSTIQLEGFKDPEMLKFY